MIAEEMMETIQAETLAATRTRHFLVIGMGNRHRHDDQVGLYVAHRLRERNLDPAVQIVKEDGDILDLLDSWQGADVIFLVDAVCSGAEAGTIHRFKIGNDVGCDEIIPQNLFLYSTHAFGLSEVVLLAQSLGKLPRRLLVYGIEGADFDMGEGLTLNVLGAAEQVVEEIASHIRSIDDRR